MIFPIGDTYPRRTFPIFNTLLILANLAVFVYMYFLIETQQQFTHFVGTYALHPDRWTDVKTHFTSMFLHGGVLHLLGNMLFLLAAGNSLEDRLTHSGYLLFYVACGLAGAAAHVVMALTLLPSMAPIPTVGASGAISGVIGGHLAALPGNRLKLVIFPFVFWPLNVPAWLIIPFWVALQVSMAMAQLDSTPEGGVAVFAHLGGFALGFLLLLWLRLSGSLKPPRRTEE